MAKIGITIPKPEPFLLLAGPLARVPSRVGQGVPPPPAICLTESSENRAMDLSSIWMILARGLLQVQVLWFY